MKKFLILFDDPKFQIGLNMFFSIYFTIFMIKDFLNFNNLGIIWMMLAVMNICQTIRQYKKINKDVK